MRTDRVTRWQAFWRAMIATALLCCLGANAAKAEIAAEQVAAQPVQAPANCGLLLAQAGSAGAGLVGSTYQMIKTCNERGWDSIACAGAIAVELSSLVWAWWNLSNWLCKCVDAVKDSAWGCAYCAAFAIIPKPPAPGGGGVPPVGPPAR